MTYLSHFVNKIRSRDTTTLHSWRDGHLTNINPYWLWMMQWSGF